MISGIYMIYNTVNGKFYIGSAINLNMRFATHKYKLKNNTHANKYLQNAWNKQWGQYFQFHVIEYCEKGHNTKREQWWFDITHCYDRKIGYNARPRAETNLGRKQSIEEIAKRKLATIGLKRTEESKEKMRLAQKGRKPSEEVHAKRLLAIIGKPLSEEHKRKLSLVSKGRKQTPEAIANRAAGVTGKPLSENHKRNISLSRIGNTYRRDSTKWPCADGCACKCIDCVGRRKKFYYKYRKKNEKNSDAAQCIN